MSGPSPWSHSKASRTADDIRFEIQVQKPQFVEIEIDPGDSAVAEAGSLVWKDASVDRTAVYGN